MTSPFCVTAHSLVGMMTSPAAAGPVSPDRTEAGHHSLPKMHHVQPTAAEHVSAILAHDPRQ